ncbi:hypothetical protein BGZ99_010435 [Dissophora globulifera]|uniref:Uncharacterized protein n=1 Tax=Dissophora globulifera TaxID=979702 RepID=A0A9P6RQW3_9FUNG|nr:hypothetical protein BGZ99_010435 [Dissophora globulifera]
MLDYRDWFNSFKVQYPLWSQDCCLEELDPGGWKRYVLKNAAMCRRLGAPMPADAFLLSPSSGMDVDSLSVASQVPSIPASTQNVGHVRPRALLQEAISYTSDDSTAGEGWRRIGSPVYHIDEPSKSVISASMLMRPSKDANNWLRDRRILLYGLPDLKNPLAICNSDLWTKPRDDGESWFYPFDNANYLKVGQVMDIRHYPHDIKDQKLRVVMVLAFGENARPADSTDDDVHVLDIWLIVKIVEILIPITSTGLSPTHAGSPLEFSGGVNSWSLRHTDLDMTPRPMVQPEYKRIETIEPSQHNIDLRGRIAKLYVAKAPPKIAQEGTSQGEQDLEPTDDTEYDCIALFGMQNSEASPALVIKKILFLEDKEKSYASWSKKQISRGVSCLTLFPYQSRYERMLVLFNRHGRGMIWDWVNERQIAQLHLQVDKTPDNASSSSADGKGHVTVTETEIESEAKAAAVKALAAVRRPLYYWGVQVSWAVHPMLGESRKNSSFRIVTLADGVDTEWESCWWHIDSEMLGSVDPELEIDLQAPPFIPTCTQQSSSAAGSASVTSASTITESATTAARTATATIATAATTTTAAATTATTAAALESMNLAPAAALTTRTKPTVVTPLPRPPLPRDVITRHAESRRYEKETTGYCLPEQRETHSVEHKQPLKFIAYVIWNHYRIGLTTQMGLAIFDMEDGGRLGGTGLDTDHKDWQWVTFLDNMTEDPVAVLRVTIMIRRPIVLPKKQQ